MINGTKLLNVTSLTRGRRDRILRIEQVKHIVRAGPMDLIGVWITFERALELANSNNITEILYPLFVPDIGGLFYPRINQRFQIPDSIGMCSSPSISSSSTRIYWTGSSHISSGVGGQDVKSAKVHRRPRLGGQGVKPAKVRRRSQLGCYTCRLRKKKCDEGQSCCKACRDFGLQCEYERPIWWTNQVLQQAQLENLKSIVRRNNVSQRIAHESMTDRVDADILSLS